MVSRKRRVGPPLVADLDDLPRLPRGLDDRVEVNGSQAHRLLAVEVLAGGEDVEVEPRVQVARDRGDDGIDAVEPEQLLPFGGALRAFLALVRDHLQPALEVRRVDVAHRPDLHARDLQEVLKQDRPTVTHTDDPDADGVVRTSLGGRFAGNKLPGHQSSGRAQEPSTMYACHGRVLPQKKRRSMGPALGREHDRGNHPENPAERATHRGGLQTANPAAPRRFLD